MKGKKLISIMKLLAPILLLIIAIIGIVFAIDTESTVIAVGAFIFATAGVIVACDICLSD